MAIITISRGSASRGQEVAELVAKKLGYACISREIILDASEQFNIPEVKLTRAIHDAPSILERFTYGKEKYVAFFQATLLKFLRDDNAVYHGLAGQFLLPNIGHVLKVRMIADMDNRVRLEMERGGMNYQDALHQLKKDDEQRRKWSQSLYGFDSADPSLYDLVIHKQKITVEDAADIICYTVSREAFQTTAESRKAIQDLSLAAEIRAALVNLNPSVEVSANDGKVEILAKIPVPDMASTEDLKRKALAIRGVREVEVRMEATPRFTD
ncbi:MAG TPA: histidine kinase [Syntrophobacteraceae bacterium]|nr:histidine kinase [Syntrophobacteraceae bacterium]